MISLKIGITSNSTVWEKILNQEKYPVSDLTSNVNSIENPVLICDSNTEIDFNIIERAVTNGSIALVTSLYYSLHFTSSLFSERAQSIIPDPDSIFSNLEALEINGYIFYIPGMNWLDKNLRISTHQHGKGHFIIMPFELEDLYTKQKIKRKKFYDSRQEFPSERVAAIHKGLIRELLNNLLEYSFRLLDLPLVKLNYFPANWKNIFCFRVDTDFCSAEQAENLYKLCKKHEISATWFVDTKDSERLKACYGKFENQEIGLHCYRHLVFEDEKKNKENMEKGLNALEQVNLKATGFAAPYGEWNIELDSVLQKSEFLYSSEFGFDYDNFPVKYTSESPWQIPIHPISTGRLRRSHYSEEEMIKYYKKVIDHHLIKRIPIVIYYHPHRELLNVIESIFSYVKELEIPALNMLEFAQWWEYRNSLNFEAYEDCGSLVIDSKLELKQAGLCVKSNKKTALINFVNKVDLKELYWIDDKKFCVPVDYARIYDFHWRDLLYDFESKKGKRKQ